MPEIEETGLAVVVGRAIAKRRVACGLTQEQVAEHLRIGVEAVSRMERGVALPTVVRLGELADIFQCEVADLLTETSGRANDQARYIERLLSRLDSADRLMVVVFVEQLATRLANGTGAVASEKAQAAASSGVARSRLTSKAITAAMMPVAPDTTKAVR